MTLFRTVASRLQQLQRGLLALLTIGLVAVTAPALAADDKGYREVQTDVSSPEGKILVQEFFWYGCPHCYHLEAELEPWLERIEDDVVFERRALALGEHWLPMTRAYYAADLLDAVEDTHREVFLAIHEDGKRLRDLDAIAGFYADLGVDEQAFRDAYQGFSVQNEIRKTGQIAHAAGVRGVPALLVDGRYLVTGRLAGGNAEMLQVVDSLIEQIRDQRD
ncbi:thiol:disulfide interchange protein DsbA/DsbL [Guyparkeria hydrothermalis]|uniref:thiol:disulfide interchange protein DsbA/DsbL n=1 Tax=Guyparkeria hydrothermalis TaxID=923 RepID=UPI0020210A11|nr:thiol:disulfide interchange protein DsbA/DsbL [Guyparkeria hydrothermalis]MCL7745019.1 thiol:disulfide interchange protein DsbA/DsbL [Guyparkeria hydrothermalis]